MSSDFLRVMAYLCDRQVFVAGQTIVTVGDPADAAVILFMEPPGSSGVCGTWPPERDCASRPGPWGQFRWLYSVRAATEVDCLLLPRHKILPQFQPSPSPWPQAWELIDSVVGWDQRQLEVPLEMRWDGLGML